MLLKVERCNSDSIKDLNFPLIILNINSDIFPEGIYPVELINLNTNQTKLNITCRIQYKNNGFLNKFEKMIDTNNENIEGTIYISNPQRSSLKVDINGKIKLISRPKVYLLNEKNLPSFKINIINIKNNGKIIPIYKEEIKQSIEQNLNKICLNNNLTYIIFSNKIPIYFEITINNDEETVCQYGGQEFNIFDITTENICKNKCFIVNSVCQSTNLIKKMDLSHLQIGGLKTQISEFLRRVFASRACHPYMIKLLNISHVKGVLLYGPPGTGKTLFARELGKLANSVEPIIVNGPEILSKYVGESSENIRKLFIPAENEYKIKGEYSHLHIIIFDEFDAIGKSRTTGDSVSDQVANQIVTQLLSKMDGINSLNNILVIGLTNRKDIIDKALLRPGRFEVQLEIGIPDKLGRSEIFAIHLSKYIENKMLDPEVNIDNLVDMTENFSGAEIAGVVKDAVAMTMYRHIKQLDDKTISLDKDSDIMVTLDDLKQGIKNINPLFGRDKNIFETILPLHLEWHPRNNQNDFLEKGYMLCQDYLTNLSSFQQQSYKILLTGKQQTGKTITSVYFSQKFKDITNIKYLSNVEMIKNNEFDKSKTLQQFIQNAERTTESIIIFDDIDYMMEISDTKRGFIFNNTIMNIFRTLWSMPIKNKIIMIMTAKNKTLIEDIGLMDNFHFKFNIESQN